MNDWRAPRVGRAWARFKPDDCPLTERQLQVAALLALDYNREQIGALLTIEGTTIRTHVFEGCRKLDLHNATALAATVAVRWMHTPRSGRQHYVDEFDRRLAEVRVRHTQDRRQPFYPELDDLIKLTLLGD